MRVLLVEDEPRIQVIVQLALSKDNFVVEVAATAEHAMERVGPAGEVFDAFLLDVVLPGLSGLDFCRWLRDQGHKEPILLLTARGSIADRVSGLDAGADDYLIKPFEVSELRARFRALSRKVQGYPRDPLVVADLVFDPDTRVARRAGREVSLSRKEASLLEYLMKNQDRVVTRSMIANAVWDTETNQYTNVIDVFINHIRHKIDTAYPLSRPLVHTIRGKGFRLTDAPSSEKEP